MCICVQVKYPLFLSEFDENLIFRQIFLKTLKYQISSQSVHWETSCSMNGRTDGWTDKHDETNSRFFAILRTPKKIISN